MSGEQGKKLGEILIQAGIISREQLNQASALASENKSPHLIVSLLELGFLTFKVFEKFIVTHSKLKSAIISSHDLMPELISRVGMRIIESSLVLPISLREERDGKLLALGMVDPTDSKIIKRIEENLGCRVVPILISLPDFKNALKKSKTHLPDQSQISIGSNSINLELEDNVNPSNDDPIRSTGISLPSASVNTVKKVEYMSLVGQKFKEEILAKLDLNPKEAQLLTSDIYDRDNLTKHLQKLGRGSLQKIYDEASVEARIEGLQNTLLAKGLISKHDILLSTALSAVFDGEKK